MAEILDGIRVTGGHGIHHAVAHMVLQYHLAGVVDGASHGCQLDQNLGAVGALLHHPLYLLQMADGPGQTVDDSLLVFVNMAVGMGNAVSMHIGVVVFVMMFLQKPFLLPLFRYIILHFRISRKPGGGIIPENKCFDR